VIQQPLAEQRVAVDMQQQEGVQQGRTRRSSTPAAASGPLKQPVTGQKARRASVSHVADERKAPRRAAAAAAVTAIQTGSRSGGRRASAPAAGVPAPTALPSNSKAAAAAGPDAGDTAAGEVAAAAGTGKASSKPTATRGQAAAAAAAEPAAAGCITDAAAAAKLAALHKRTRDGDTTEYPNIKTRKGKWQVFLCSQGIKYLHSKFTAHSLAMRSSLGRKLSLYPAESCVWGRPCSAVLRLKG
jgi:hypothetical protein